MVLRPASPWLQAIQLCVEGAELILPTATDMGSLPLWAHQRWWWGCCALGHGGDLVAAPHVPVVLRERDIRIRVLAHPWASVAAPLRPASSIPGASPSSPKNGHSVPPVTPYPSPRSWW